MYLSNLPLNKQFKIFFWLLYRDLLELKKNIAHNLFDGILWPLKIIILYGYFLPGLGLSNDYGGLILAVTIITVSFAGVFDSTNDILIESQEQSKLSYELTLPINSGFIYIKKILIFALKTLIIGLFIYPIGMLFLGDLFDFSNASFLKITIIVLLVNLMFASFSLLLASVIKQKNIYLSNFGWFLWLCMDLGCTNYTWQVLKSTIPFLSFIALLNPITYASEASRVAVFGQQNYINFWVSIFIILIVIIVFSVYAIKFMKKKLDSF